MTPEVTYVPTVIQWEENGKTMSRTVNIQEGIKLDFKDIDKNQKQYTATAYDTSKGKMPLLSLSKEEAYSILGFSRMYDDTENNIFTLDQKDFDLAKESYGSNQTNYLENRLKNRAGYGAQIKQARFAYDKEGKPEFNQFNIRLNNETRISVFNSKK